MLAGLSSEQCIGFPPLCPDLVVELACPSDEGTRLGWLLIPEQQTVVVWPPSGDPQRCEGHTVLEAGPDFSGLQLRLEEIWAGWHRRELIAQPLTILR